MRGAWCTPLGIDASQLPQIKQGMNLVRSAFVDVQVITLLSVTVGYGNSSSYE